MTRRVAGLAAAAVVLLPVTAGLASAATHDVVAAGPSDALRAPVGLTAVGLGLAGMVVGALRKKKVQPENQRKG
ncbi:hypothetical protein [Saccharopolyspora griseoalba]|uniref:Uncharacterized protein n=1 Tax=Saccharopolyspora griseoalba TaxID=1431848 RepID=A0ABW2LHU7_9PSEU